MISNINKTLQSILVKPTGPDCNLACDYCFYIDKCSLYPDTKRHKMSTKTLEVLIKNAMKKSGNEISITWQGGEPTLMGIEFYKKVIELETKYGQGKIVGNGLQTNGILINDNWADFLKKYNFLVGLSIDGPKHIHNHYRKTPNGNGSFDKVFKAAKVLFNKGVAVNAMCCVTDYSSQYPEELYNFYKNLGFEFIQFIPIVETDKNDIHNSASFSVSAKQYGDFLCKIFDLWFDDFSKGIANISIRHFESIFFMYVGFDAPECPLKEECGVYPLVEHNGDVYACDFFVEPEWKLGNIHKDRMINLINSDKMTEFGRRKSNLPKICKSCKWLKYCYGGCTKDRVRDPKDRGNNHFCLSYRMFLEHADPILSQMAKEWKKQNNKNITYDASGHFK